MSTVLKPAFYFSGNDWDKEHYEIKISREGITSPYTLDDYQTMIFPTYYFKETQEKIIN